jgi:protein arginine kinase activator
MNQLPIEPNPDKMAERPLECTECHRPIAVRYTEIVGGTITHTSMCAECPQLERRLHGIRSESLIGSQAETGLVCGDCGTTLANVRMGSLLGCSHCYEVFGDAILNELQTMNRFPTAVIPHKKGLMAHTGRAPGELIEISPSSRLAALNDALIETLTREDYEQAAYLRDQIKKLTENPESEKSNEGQQ